MRKTMLWVACSVALQTTVLHARAAGDDDIEDRSFENELSYSAFVHSGKRIKCLYGYAANKTGDHAAAIQIFEDCIRRWDDVFSMIGLAQMYETGIGIRQDIAASTRLMKRAACINDGTSYPSLARYHYGIALAEGRGIGTNIAEARTWLGKAAAEGVKEAADYLAGHDAGFTQAAPEIEPTGPCERQSAAEG